jgi:DNA processing protein
VIDAAERAALLLLLRSGTRSWQQYADMVEDTASALALVDQELGLLGRAALDDTQAEIARWQAAGLRLETVLDPTYPQNLRAVHDRPPFIFVAGRLESRDARSVAVIGTRKPTLQGARTASAIARHLVGAGYTVVSGLAAGIDTAAHTGTLMAGGRTMAVIGTGINHAYPRQNAELQRVIATDGVVVSQFWPDQRPTKPNFPLRNAVMSGLTLATVIVEASHTSGARVQARLALAHGRPVFLLRQLLEQQWARDLSQKPGTYVVSAPREITATIERLTSADVLIA